jgi:hypothetical protein
MTHEEAQFILRASRPDGSDLDDPIFAEALARARRDPELAAWLERERALDTAIADRLASVAPPAELRAALLAGGNVMRRPRWRLPAWLAVAAAGVLLLGGTLYWTSGPAPAPTFDEIARLALRDMASGHWPGRMTYAADVGAFGAWLTAPHQRLREGYPVDFGALRALRCRTVRLGRLEVFEICFEREGSFHLYIAPRDGVRLDHDETEPMFREQGGLAAVTWADARAVYVLVTALGPEALRRIW